MYNVWRNVNVLLAWQRSPRAVCRGAPEESGPAGVTLLNLIGETKLTNAVDSNPIHIAHTTRAEFCVNDIFNEAQASHAILGVDFRWQENKSNIGAVIDSEDVYNGLLNKLSQTEHFANSRLLFGLYVRLSSEATIYQLKIADILWLLKVFSSLNHIRYQKNAQSNFFRQN